jgi:hypothetical protein
MDTAQDGQVEGSSKMVATEGESDTRKNESRLVPQDTPEDGEQEEQEAEDSQDVEHGTSPVGSSGEGTDTDSHDDETSTSDNGASIVSAPTTALITMTQEETSASPPTGHVRLVSRDGVTLLPIPASPPPSYAFAALSYDMATQLQLERGTEDRETTPVEEPAAAGVGPTNLGETTVAAAAPTIEPTNAEAGPSQSPAPPPGATDASRPFAFSRTSMLELLPPSDSDSDNDLPSDHPRSSTVSSPSTPRRTHFRRPSSPGSIRSLIQIMDHTGQIADDEDQDGSRPAEASRDGFARDVTLTRWRVVGGSKWNDAAARGEAVKGKFGAYVGKWPRLLWEWAWC